MTYAEAVALKTALESALLTAATSGAVSFSHGSRSITYSSKADATKALSEINRSIQTYHRRSNSQNPFSRSPIWR